MKVNKSSSAYPFVYKDQYGDSVAHTGIPLRLEIASKLLSSLVAERGFVVITEYSFLCGASLELADKLIDAHNKSCEGE